MKQIDKSILFGYRYLPSSIQYLYYQHIDKFLHPPQNSRTIIENKFQIGIQHIINVNFE